MRPTQLSAPERSSAFELRHLIALVTVSQTGSFRAAAEDLGYVQSAVSRQIAALEQHAGTKLLERAPGSSEVRVTHAGNVLVGHAKAVLAQLTAARSDLKHLADGDRGVVRLGTPQGIGLRLLPAILARYRRLEPDVQVQPSEFPTCAPLFTLVEAGSLDLAVACLPLEPGPYEMHEMLAVRWNLFVPSSWPIARTQRSIRLEDLSRFPLILPHADRSGPPIESRMQAARHEFNVAFRTDIYSTARGLVSAGVGAAVLPSFAVDRQDTTVSTLELEGISLTQRLGIFWHRERQLIPAAERFRALISEVCATLDPGRRVDPEQSAA